MARKTKTTKRTSSAKKRGLFSNVDFNSRKTQFITVILLVAVLGGGWFTYKSFAATGPNWRVADSFKCREYTEPIKDPGGNEISPEQLRNLCTKVNEPGKNNLQVAKLTAGLANASMDSTKTVDVKAGASYRICIVAKGDSQAGIFAGLYNPNATMRLTEPNTRSFQINDANNYREYCSGNLTASQTTKAYVYVGNQHTAPSGSTAYISVVSVDQVTSSQPAK